MTGLPDTFAGTVLDFITGRAAYVWAPASIGTAAVAITTGVVTVSVAHGLLVNDAVLLGAMTNGAPLTAGVVYYVASVPSTTTLTLATTNGGLPIVTTTAGTSVSITKASGNTYSGPTWLACLSVDPGDDPTMATIIEIADAGYARQPFTFTVPTLSPRGTGNAALFTYGPFTAGTAAGVAYVALVEAATGSTGKVRYVWALDTVVQPGIGESIQFPAATLTLGW
jgi:hypothetical protein